jgi:hypothetical protein
MMDAAELSAYIRAHFTRSAYRWERQPAYEVASDGNDFGRYLANEPEPTWQRLQPWLDHLADERARGLYRHRVRLLHEPLHPYERYECEWGYALTSAAGEDVRVLHPGEHQIPADLVDHDYWLLDDQHAVRMHYSDSGEFLGATVEPDLVDSYRAARELVLGPADQPVAEEFALWWSRHPELRRDADRKVS